MNTKDKQDRELVSALDATLLTYVRAVIYEQIKFNDDEYTVGVGSEWREDSDLSASIEAKFGIKIYFIDKHRSNNPISILFVLTEKLGEIFKEYEYPPFLYVSLDADNGDDFFTFTSRNDLNVLKHCGLLYRNQKNKEKFSEFVEEVKKELLLITIKYS